MSILVLLAVRPGGRQQYSPDEGPPLQALLQVERPIGRDVGEGQGGDEEGKADGAWANGRCSEIPMSGERLHRWRKTGTARKKRRRRRWATGRSKRSTIVTRGLLVSVSLFFGFFYFCNSLARALLYFLGALSVCLNLSGRCHRPRSWVLLPVWDGRQK